MAAKKMHTTTVNPRILSRPFFGQRHTVDEPIIFLWERKQEKLNLNFSDLDPIVGTLKQAGRILYAYGKSPTMCSKYILLGLAIFIVFRLPM
jgi:hypothetical protein